MLVTNLYNRMFVVDRDRGGSAHCPVETLTIAGTIGNIYTIKIDRLPCCDCPHALKGNQCKHIIYALVRVLHAPPNLRYQLAFLSSELRVIFAQAPPIPTADADDSDGKRKKIEAEDECPICCMEFEEETEDIVYCKAACGNNIHRECFNQWAVTKQGSGLTATCPFCRTAWQDGAEDIKSLAKTGPHNREGYVNLSTQLGLSGRRDSSTYHQPWYLQRERGGVDLGGGYNSDDSYGSY